MDTISFIHLHLHSSHSPLDGYTSIDAYFRKAESYGMPGLDKLIFIAKNWTGFRNQCSLYHPTSTEKTGNRRSNSPLAKLYNL